MYNCPTIDSDIFDCIQESSCAHSMDVRVKCTQSTVTVTSGALIGLLAAALVVVVTGWIVTCVYLQWKIDK